MLAAHNYVSEMQVKCLESELRCAEQHAESLRALAIARGQQTDALRRALQVQKQAAPDPEDDGDDYVIEAAWGCNDEGPRGRATLKQQVYQCFPVRQWHASLPDACTPDRNEDEGIALHSLVSSRIR